MMSERKILVAATPLLVILVLLFAPLEIPDQVKGVGKIIPAREWVLVREGDAAVYGILRDHRIGIVETYTLSRFERGDVIRFVRQQGYEPGDRVAAGDTVGRLQSSLMEEELIGLTAELATANASVGVFTTGEKTAVIESARARLESSLEQVRLHQQAIKRLQLLNEQNVVTDQELEIALAEQEAREAAVQVARTELSVVEQGAKDAEVDLARTLTTGLHRQIAALNKRIELMNVITPVSGRIVRSFCLDTLLQVQDTTEPLALLLIPWQEVKNLQQGQEVSLKPVGTGLDLRASLVAWDGNVQILNGAPVVIATARLLDEPGSLLSGVPLEYTLKKGSLAPLSYTRRLLWPDAAP